MSRNRFAWYKLRWYLKYFLSPKLLQITWEKSVLLTEGGGFPLLEKSSFYQSMNINEPQRNFSNSVDFVPQLCCFRIRNCLGS